MRKRRQRLGQHFLRDDAVARTIVESLPALPARAVEIGPGRGALTAKLLERYGRIRAIELDPTLAASLPARLGRPAGLEVVEDDALVTDLDRLATDGPWLLAGNLPYSVGTAILRRFLPRYDQFPTLVVMVQHEVARRLVAPPGNAARGLVTLEVEMFSNARLLFTVPPRAFVPPPKVTSAVVRLDLRPAPAPEPVVTRALALASAAFSHRRKKLPNALATLSAPGATVAALDSLGLDASLRPQELTLTNWLALAAALAATREATP